MSAVPLRLRAALRATGATLGVLVATHVLSVAWFAGRAEEAFSATQMRLSNPLWRFLDWLTFLVAAVHGAASLAVLVHGRVASPRARAAAEALTLALGLLLVALATFAYLTLPLYPRNPMHGGP